MWHHNDGDYKEAAGRAAAVGRQKMEAVIDKGRASAEAVVAQIQGSQPTDRIVRTADVRIVPGDFDGYTLKVGYDNRADRVHPNAFGQIMADTGLGTKFATELAKEAGKALWGKDLVAHNVNEIFAHRQKQRNLVRLDGDSGQVKGFLSDKYRRLDSRPLADAFMGVCVETGLVPIEGVASDTKCRIRAVLPKVFEPLEDEVMIFGLEFGNSDYGDGGMVLNLWTMRMMCTNLAITQKGLRQIHLGGRLPDDLHFSEETYRRDAETTALALRDVGRQLVGPEPINRMLTAVSEASEQEIRSADGIDKYLRGLSKGEANTVKQLFDSPDEVNMPAGNTVYRLSNAVSFFAQNRTIGTDRRLELQEVAGRIIVPEQAAKSVREV